MHSLSLFKPCRFEGSKQSFNQHPYSHLETSIWMWNQQNKPPNVTGEGGWKNLFNLLWTHILPCTTKVHPIIGHVTLHSQTISFLLSNNVEFIPNNSFQKVFSFDKPHLWPNKWWKSQKKWLWWMITHFQTKEDIWKWKVTSTTIFKKQSFNFWVPLKSYRLSIVY
jgi:hypothetical protein